MTDNMSSTETRPKQHHNYFDGRLQRLIFPLLIGLLAGMFEVFLLVMIRRVTRSIRIPVMVYLIPLFHLLPGFAGLSCWSAVRRARIKGAISPDAADLCWRAIIAILSATYIALAYLELTFLLPYHQ